MGVLDFKSLFRSWITPYLTEIKANAGSGGGSSYVPNKTYIQKFETYKTFSTTPVLLHQYAPVTIQPGKCINMKATFPVRNDSNSWGGCYIETHCIVGGVQRNLGHRGYNSEAMANSAKIIGFENIDFDLDFITAFGLSATTAYTVEFIFYAKAYDGTTQINNPAGANDQTIFNSAHTIETIGADQNMSKLVITEIDNLTII